jgi:hypothetical protein
MMCGVSKRCEMGHKRPSSTATRSKSMGSAFDYRASTRPSPINSAVVTIACNIDLVRKPRTYLTSISRAGWLAAKVAAGIGMGAW